MSETPAYVYDLAEVRRSYGLLRSSLPAPSELYYSLKANPHPLIVAELRSLGCLAEVCSPGELRVALDAGFTGSDLLYTGPGKRDQDLLAAVKEGVTLFSVDSPAGLDQLDSFGVPVRAIVRINDDQPVPGHGLTMTGVPSQFGADLAWVLRDPLAFGPRPNVSVIGFHLYMGTNLVDEGALLNQFWQAARTARQLADLTGLGVEVLDLGGGFGAPFARSGVLPSFPGLADGLAELLDETFPGWRSGWPVVAFESGRYLTATCGTLRTRVLDVKHSQSRPVIVLESGVNHLGGMSGLRRLPPIVPDVLADGVPVPDTIVAGPLCTPVDTWARSAAVAPVSIGDVVTVPNVGAYGLYASLVGFLGHPLPLEIVVDDGFVVDESRLALRRERG